MANLWVARAKTKVADVTANWKMSISQGEEGGPRNIEEAKVSNGRALSRGLDGCLYHARIMVVGLGRGTWARVVGRHWGGNLFFSQPFEAERHKLQGRMR